VEDCRLRGATLAIGKFDRLSGHAAFLLQLRQGDVPIVAANTPEAGFLQVGPAEMISRRRKEALAAAKQRGVKLGNPGGARALPLAGEGNEAPARAIRDKFLVQSGPLPTAHCANDAARDRRTSAVVRKLNEQEIPAPRGGKWMPSSAARLLQRFESEQRRPLQQAAQALLGRK